MSAKVVQENNKNNELFDINQKISDVNKKISDIEKSILFFTNGNIWT